jgi:hypothetical protein
MKCAASRLDRCAFGVPLFPLGNFFLTRICVCWVRATFGQKVPAAHEGAVCVVVGRLIVGKLGMNSDLVRVIFGMVLSYLAYYWVGRL